MIEICQFKLLDQRKMEEDHHPEEVDLEEEEEVEVVLV